DNVIHAAGTLHLCPLNFDPLHYVQIGCSSKLELFHILSTLIPGVCECQCEVCIVCLYVCERKGCVCVCVSVCVCVCVCMCVYTYLVVSVCVFICFISIFIIECRLSDRKSGV